MADVVGAWDSHYVDLTERFAYGEASYPTIARWMAYVELVEDWGCGGGALAEYLPPGVLYRGVDGSATPYADVHADLRTYTSDAPGVVLRHVLEHNDEWELVLANACRSFTRRLMIVLFTPLVDDTRVMLRETDYGDVPVIAFALTDLLDVVGREIPNARVRFRTVESPDTAFGVETMIRIKR